MTFFSIPTIFDALIGQDRRRVIQTRRIYPNLVVAESLKDEGDFLARGKHGTRSTAAEFRSRLSNHRRNLKRDFIYVSDLARARVAALRRLKNGPEILTLNLGSGRSYSNFEIASAIERVTGHPVPVWSTLHERSTYSGSSRNILISK